MAKGKKNKPPARDRYEKKNPVVSCRVDRALHDRLQAAKLAGGKSYADILRIGLGMLEVKVRKEKEIRDRAYEEGYDKGYEDAAKAGEEFVVPYRCVKCGEEIIVTTDEEKKAIAIYMRENGWGHGDCLNR